MKKAKQRIKILLSYNGLKYYGWQKQKKLPSIQGEIEKALKNLFKEDISVIGSGRTDTGTHAIGQTAHFDISKNPGPYLQKALNAFLLPKNICVRKVWRAPDHFHAKNSAIEKHYIYFILNRQWPCVFRKGQVYWHPHQLLDKKALQSISNNIPGTYDFKSFQNSGTILKNTIRTVTLAKWQQNKKHLLAFHVKGDGFLKQMVRNLVGVQLALLKEPNPIKKWQEILLAKDRKVAYKTVPACGLYLYGVSYPYKLDRDCQKI